MEVCWGYGLAADGVVGNRSGGGRTSSVEQVSGAQIQPSTGHALWVLNCRSRRIAGFGGIPGAARGTASNHSENEMIDEAALAELQKLS